MTKVQNISKSDYLKRINCVSSAFLKRNNCVSDASLDTLVQLRKTNQEAPPLLDKKNLTKRARSKHISNKITLSLADLNSPLKKAYWNTFYCNETLIQNGQTITGKYCKNRWCSTCNRIRTAQLIKGYTEPLSNIDDKHFVTLTVPNVRADELKIQIETMLSEFGRIKDTFRKRKTPIIGIRKLECTYNSNSNTYHPHFHIIVSGKHIAIEIVKEWLERFPDTNNLAQDVRAADDNSVHELFKYFTKIATYSKIDKTRKIHIVSLDTIFRAMKGKRVFQPMGIKKYVPEDIEEIQSQEYDIEEQFVEWKWNEEYSNWIDIQTGECLTDYEPSPGVIELLKNIVISHPPPS